MAVKDTDLGTSRDTAGALREAFQEHYLPLLRLATLLSQEPHTAEDLVQEIFVRAAARLATLSSEEVRPYLRRAVVNLWKTTQRQAARSGRLTWQLDESSTDADPADRELMRGLLLGLAPRQRACLVLRYYEDLTGPQIAEVLGCSEGTVKSQTSKALKRLRKEIDHER
jgi:RNA polymerase sigma-70 factor (sigma-E family)